MHDQRTLEAMARRGVEVILGATRDPKFGPLCMFGLGGTFVEAMRDVTFRIAPMWEASAENTISSIKAYRVFRGIRGTPPCLRDQPILPAPGLPAQDEGWALGFFSILLGSSDGGKARP